MEKCEFCGKENTDKITLCIAMPEGRVDLKVCSECLNEYGDEMFSNLNRKIEAFYGKPDKQDAKD